jgi:hypothetical protein
MPAGGREPASSKASLRPYCLRSRLQAPPLNSDGDGHAGIDSREDLVQAAREAGDAAVDVLIACAFNYDAHSAEFNKLGRIPVLRPG